MSPKIAVSAAALSLLSLSGCCRFFGICTSVAVHTSITPTRSYEYALSNSSTNSAYANVLTSSIMTLAATNRHISHTFDAGLFSDAAYFMK
jgi:hypothetical protein